MLFNFKFQVAPVEIFKTRLTDFLAFQFELQVSKSPQLE